MEYAEEKSLSGDGGRAQGLPQPRSNLGKRKATDMN